MTCLRRRKLSLICLILLLLTVILFTTYRDGISMHQQALREQIAQWQMVRDLVESQYGELGEMAEPNINNSQAGKDAEVVDTQPVTDQDQFAEQQDSVGDEQESVGEVQTAQTAAPLIDFSEVAEKITARMDHIRSVCTARKDPNFNTFHIFYFDKFGISWVPVYKASSTNWKQFFIQQVYPEKAARNDYGLPAVWDKLLKKGENKGSRDGRKRTFEREPRNSIRFTIIRHPLSRLVSHYRKTITSAGEMKALKNMWVKPSILLARKVPSNLRKQYENELERWLSGTFTPSSDSTNPYLRAPTFSEFVSWMLAARKKRDWRGTNDHWTPASQWTDICQNNLDFVVKLENEQVEIPYLLEQLGLSEHLEYFLGKHNSSGEKEVAGSEVERYMSELSEEQKARVNDIYEMDYEVFGYDPV